MKEKKSVTILSILLVFAVILLFFVIVKNVISDTQQKHQILSNISSNFSLSSKHISSMLKQAVSENQREKALSAAVLLAELNGVTNTQYPHYAGIQFKQTERLENAFEFMSRTILYGDETLGIPVLGSVNDDRPYTEAEIAVIQNYINALDEFADFFDNQKSGTDLSDGDVTVSEFHYALKSLEEYIDQHLSK